MENYLSAPTLIAGPCVIESEQLLDTVAQELVRINQELGVDIIFKASFDKANRTSIRSFRGPGLEKGIELLRFIPMVLHMNVPIISMTSNPDSLLAKYSNAHIKVWVEHEACPLNLAPTSSTTAALAMGDALAVALMTVRDFKPRDFAQFHPGGELGRKLLTTAEDVMLSLIHISEPTRH